MYKIVKFVSTALQTPAWLAIPLGLLLSLAAGGLYVYMKRRHNKDAGTEQNYCVFLLDFM